MPTAQAHELPQPYPKLHHVALNTTFCGVCHPSSTPEAPIHQYLGIKYASIPARFRQSKLFDAYPAITDASKNGPICPQSKEKLWEEVLFNIPPADVPNQSLKQDEFGCLNLNITCPAGLSLRSRLPVMVWIHGGGDRGSGSCWIYDGGALVRKSIEVGKPVIVVSINYRLGLLGFASSPALRDDNKEAGDEGTGNYGLRDQQRALDWLHRYIAEFGGDPQNITLFGESSGAMDIICHLLSVDNETRPTTKMLFSRAIIQSAVFEPYLPDVANAGWHLSRIMSALHVSNVEQLRAVDVHKLVTMQCMHRAIDDESFFRKDWKDFFSHEEKTTTTTTTTLKVPAMSHAKSRSRSRLRQLRSASRARSVSVTTPPPSSSSKLGSLQPLIIGDSCSDSLLWSLPISMWTAPAVVRRLKAVCQSLSKASNLLRAYEITSCTPDDEIVDRLLELVNDARVAWPTECIARNAKNERGRASGGSVGKHQQRSVFRYVFDQEGPSRGVPHHAADLIYLFDNCPLPDVRVSEEVYCDGPFSDDEEEDEDMSNGGGGHYDDEWETYVVDQYSYARVRDSIQEKWITFAYREAPWSEDKVFVFGPEGETGERSQCIFEGRRRSKLWKEVFEPLGMQLVQKVGTELSRGP